MAQTEQISERTRRLVEADLRLHPERAQIIETLRHELAQRMPLPLHDRLRPMAGVHKVDATWKAVDGLFRHKDYRRYIRIIQAMERLYQRLDPQCRRVLEAYYWSGLDMAETAAEIGASEATVLRRRHEIVALALKEFQRAGVGTYSGRRRERKKGPRS